MPASTFRCRCRRVSRTGVIASRLNVRHIPLTAENAGERLSRMDFPERDWKHLRAVKPVALARYCERILEEAAAVIHACDESPHDRYLHLFELINDRNRVLASAFDDLRRSTALRRLSAMIALGVVTDAELAGFTPEVRESSAALSGLLLRES